MRSINVRERGSHSALVRARAGAVELQAAVGDERAALDVFTAHLFAAHLGVVSAEFINFDQRLA